MLLNRVRFRFYEELNDFLPRAKRKLAFDHLLRGKPSVKDAIESLGVPHTEVDLILVNGRSVRFTYSLKDGDRVSVYPVFEAMDISSVTRLAKRPLRVSKFILDVHLGKLARFLRLLGFDSMYRNDLSDPEIVETSVRAQRIILTRDRGLLKIARVSRGYWIRSSDPKRQVREVVERFQLAKGTKPFTLCLECNGRIRKVKKERVIHRLAPMTRRIYMDFYFCRACERVYWKGSHYSRMSRLVSELMGDRTQIA